MDQFQKGPAPNRGRAREVHHSSSTQWAVTETNLDRSRRRWLRVRGCPLRRRWALFPWAMEAFPKFPPTMKQFRLGSTFLIPFPRPVIPRIPILLLLRLRVTTGMDKLRSALGLIRTLLVHNVLAHPPGKNKVWMNWRQNSLEAANLMRNMVFGGGERSITSSSPKRILIPPRAPRFWVGPPSQVLLGDVGPGANLTRRILNMDVSRHLPEDYSSTRQHIKTRYRWPRPKRERKWYPNMNSDYLMVIALWYVLWLGCTSKCTNYRDVVFGATRIPLGKLESARNIWQTVPRRIRVPP